MAVQLQQTQIWFESQLIDLRHELRDAQAKLDVLQMLDAARDADRDWNAPLNYWGRREGTRAIHDPIGRPAR